MRAPSAPGGRKSFRHRGIWPRFRDAFRGIVLAYREEPNLRFHLFAAAAAGSLGYAVRLQGWEIAYLAVTVMIVLVAELVNTAVERAVDLASAGRRQSLAAMAKEVAAGAVLLASLHAAVAAVVLFLVERPLSTTWAAFWHMAFTAPWALLFPAAAALLGLWAGTGPSKSR